MATRKRTTTKSPAAATPVPSAPPLDHSEVAARAYFLFLERGGGHGHDWDDWLRAERDLAAMSGAAAKKTSGVSGASRTSA